ncbi:hypothetical protein RND81_03G074200 [Saponaria officinalis]|uniref:Uncharacterized protein n=1 Tax=Saponaria officinalis TaxID=3572 RepID=A0AAW1M6H1_SAPOF
MGISAKKIIQRLMKNPLRKEAATKERKKLGSDGKGKGLLEQLKSSWSKSGWAPRYETYTPLKTSRAEVYALQRTIRGGKGQSPYTLRAISQNGATIIIRQGTSRMNVGS